MEAMHGGWAMLIVGDPSEARSGLGDRMERVGFDLSYADDGLVALDVVERCPPDLILAGRQLAGLDRIGFVRRIRKFSNVPIVVIAEPASVSDCEQAMRAGADRYLELRTDLDRVATVACDLVGRRSSALGLVNHRSVTASEIRSRAKRELADELQDLLIECRGNIAEVARRMGRDRSTIRYHLRRLGMLDAIVLERIATASEASSQTRLPSGGTRRAGSARVPDRLCS